MNSEVVITNSFKVLGIGLSRTGTTSLNNALIKLGILSCHFPNFRYENGALRIDSDILSKYSGFTDTPVAASFQHLDRQFPGSKFILTTRGLDDWLGSCEKFFGGKVFDREPFQQLSIDLYGTNCFDKKLFTTHYQQHETKVRSYFASRPDDLLIIDVCQQNGWHELCHFLGKEIPKTPFPYSNRASGPAAIVSKIRRWLGKH